MEEPHLGVIILLGSLLRLLPGWSQLWTSDRKSGERCLSNESIDEMGYEPGVSLLCCKIQGAKKECRLSRKRCEIFHIYMHKCNLQILFL